MTLSNSKVSLKQNSKVSLWKNSELMFFRTEQQSREGKQDLRKSIDSYQSIEDFFSEQGSRAERDKIKKSMLFQNSTAEQRETKKKHHIGVRYWGCRVLGVSGLGGVRS